MHRSVDWIGIEKLLDEKLRPELEQLSSNGVKVFKQKNTTEKFSPDNTIYLFENQASTCVINQLILIQSKNKQ